MRKIFNGSMCWFFCCVFFTAILFFVGYSASAKESTGAEELRCLAPEIPEKILADYENSNEKLFDRVRNGDQQAVAEITAKINAGDESLFMPLLAAKIDAITNQLDDMTIFTPRFHKLVGGKPEGESFSQRHVDRTYHLCKYAVYDAPQLYDIQRKSFVFPFSFEVFGDYDNICRKVRDIIEEAEVPFIKLTPEAYFQRDFPEWHPSIKERVVVFEEKENEVDYDLSEYPELVAPLIRLSNKLRFRDVPMMIEVFNQQGKPITTLYVVVSYNYEISEYYVNEHSDHYFRNLCFDSKFNYDQSPDRLAICGCKIDDYKGVSRPATVKVAMLPYPEINKICKKMEEEIRNANGDMSTVGADISDEILKLLARCEPQYACVARYVLGHRLKKAGDVNAGQELINAAARGFFPPALADSDLKFLPPREYCSWRSENYYKYKGGEPVLPLTYAKCAILADQKLQEAEIYLKMGRYEEASQCVNYASSVGAEIWQDPAGWEKTWAAVVDFSMCLKQKIRRIEREIETFQKVEHSK